MAMRCPSNHCPHNNNLCCIDCLRDNCDENDRCGCGTYCDDAIEDEICSAVMGLEEKIAFAISKFRDLQKCMCGHLALCEYTDCEECKSEYSKYAYGKIASEALAVLTEKNA